jgi:hypothetical protein
MGNHGDALQRTNLAVLSDGRANCKTLAVFEAGKRLWA